ncbi:unnamed protein product, partial [Ranitomeya imitator]
MKDRKVIERRSRALVELGAICHYPVPRVSVSLSCTQSVSVIILYPQCQRHYPVPPVSVSLSCTPSVSVIILYPECQCHYPVLRVSASLSCTPSVSVIILYPQCQCHYPVPHACIIILYPTRHYAVPQSVQVSLRITLLALMFRWALIHHPNEIPEEPSSAVPLAFANLKEMKDSIQS